MLLSLSGSIFSLILGLSLISIMGAGLMKSYDDRASDGAPKIRSEVTPPNSPFASGVTYLLPSRSTARYYESTEDIITEAVVAPIEIEELQPQQVLAREVKPAPAPVVQAEAQPQKLAVVVTDKVAAKPEVAHIKVQPQKPQLVLTRAESISTKDILRDGAKMVFDSTGSYHDAMVEEIPDFAALSFDALLHERIDAGQQWMAATQGGYSIQLMLVTHETVGMMDDFIVEHGLEHFADDIYMFPLEGKRYLIYYGRFDQAQTARVALSQMPDRIKNSGAFIISLQDIRAKVQRLKPRHKLVTSTYY